MNRVLIVVDMQNDFAHKNGALTTPEAQKCVPAVCALIDEFRKNNEMIYFTQDTHFEDYRSTQEGLKLPIDHCRYGSWGWRIIDECDIKEDAPQAKVKHLSKTTFGYEDWFIEHLEKYDEIWLCGLVSSICVVSNALIIKQLCPETPIKFVAYASAGLNPANHKAAIEVMRSCQIEIVE